MNISIMRLANGKTEIMVNGLSVATCDTNAHMHFICAALGFALQPEGVTNWSRENITEAFNAVVAEEAAADTEGDCGE